MATTMISWNKLLNYRNSNINLDSNLAADSSGKETFDPNKAISLLPIGDYKGFGLASMIDILCGVLLNMPFGSDISSMYKDSINKPRNLGQFYIVFKPDFLQSLDNYYLSIENFIKMIKKQDSNKSYYSGELENINESKSIKNGINLTQIELDYLNEFLKN